MPRGGRSADKFRKSQIRNVADLNVLDLQNFRKCVNLRICALRTICFFRFADFRLADLKLHSNLRRTFGFWDSFDTELNGIHSLKYTYVGKKSTV